MQFKVSNFLNKYEPINMQIREKSFMINPFEEIPAFCLECGPQTFFIRYYWTENGYDPIEINLITIDDGFLRKMDTILMMDEKINDKNFNDQCICCGYHFSHNVNLDLIENKKIDIGFKI